MASLQIEAVYLIPGRSIVCAGFSCMLTSNAAIRFGFPKHELTTVAGTSKKHRQGVS